MFSGMDVFERKDEFDSSSRRVIWVFSSSSSGCCSARGTESSLSDGEEELGLSFLEEKKRFCRLLERKKKLVSCEVRG